MDEKATLKQTQESNMLRGTATSEHLRASAADAADISPLGRAIWIPAAP